MRTALNMRSRTSHALLLLEARATLPRATHRRPCQVAVAEVWGWAQKAHRATFMKPVPIALRMGLPFMVVSAIR